MIKRLLIHLFTTTATTRRAFPAPTLHAIEKSITEGETRHRAEVRFIVESSLSANDVIDRVSPRERALELFGRYLIWDTEENCGVLVYINLADRQVEIIADRGISGKITDEDWNDICQKMTDGFRERHYHESALEALESINSLLEEHFPLTEPKENQLPDTPVIL